MIYEYRRSTVLSKARKFNTVEKRASRTLCITIRMALFFIVEEKSIGINQWLPISRIGYNVTGHPHAITGG